MKNNEIYLEKKRWYMVTAFSLQCIISNLVWITFGPFVAQAATYYKKSEFEIDLASMFFAITSLVLMLPGAYIIQKKGLLFSFWAASIFNLVGSLVRCLSYLLKPENGWWFVLGGSIIVSLGQPVFLIAAPRLSAVWFSDKERTISTSIVATSNVLGMALAFILGPAIVTKDQYPELYFIEAGMVIFATIFGVFFKEAPLYPPTPLQNESKEKNPNNSNSGSASSSLLSFKELDLSETHFLLSLKQALSDINFVMLMIGFGLGFAAFATLFSALDQVVAPSGYTTSNAGEFGIIMIFSGTFGSMVFSPLLDKFRKYKEVMAINYFFTIGSLVFFYFSLFQNTSLPHTLTTVGISAGVTGFFALPLLPIALEMAVELTYPLPEALVTSLLMLSGNILVSINTVLINVLQYPNNGSMINSFRYIMVTAAVGEILVFVIKPNYKRLQFEKTMQISKSTKSVNA